MKIFIRKYYNWMWKILLKKPSCIKINSYFSFELFNPFAKRQVAEIIPYIELIPRIAIGIDRIQKYFGIKFGWLIFWVEYHNFLWKIIDESKIKK